MRNPSPSIENKWHQPGVSGRSLHPAHDSTARWWAAIWPDAEDRQLGFRSWRLPFWVLPWHPSAASSARIASCADNHRFDANLQPPAANGFSGTGLQMQAAIGMVQAGCRSLVLESWLERTLNTVVERARDPLHLRPIAFWHLHDQLQPGFRRLPGTPCKHHRENAAEKPP